MDAALGSLYADLARGSMPRALLWYPKMTSTLRASVLLLLKKQVEWNVWYSGGAQEVQVASLFSKFESFNAAARMFHRFPHRSGCFQEAGENSAPRHVQAPMGSRSVSDAFSAQNPGDL